MPSRDGRRVREGEKEEGGVSVLCSKGRVSILDNPAFFTVLLFHDFMTSIIS